MYTCGVLDPDEYQQYSVLRYLVLISTTVSTNMYLVSEIYFIQKTDIKVTTLKFVLVIYGLEITQAGITIRIDHTKITVCIRSGVCTA